jgi:RimJ/RimL family protein N-acetyltransferase
MKDITNWQPCMRPTRATRTGKYCRLEPLDPTRHGDELFAASMAPEAAERFRYLFDAPQNRADFTGWLIRAAASEDPLFFAVIALASERCEGRQRLMRITPEHGVIEVGNILWGPAIARTRVATEALYLFARYIFNDLGYRRLEWKCNARNEPSMRAAARKGEKGSGVFYYIAPHASIVCHEGYYELAALHAPDAHNLHELKKKQKSRERACPAFFYKPKEVQY